jgi:diguanylate cyclase (GGDEF)-like protein
MYSFSSFTPTELMEKYKRQTYLVVFPIGILLSVLYIINVARSGLQFYAVTVILLELVLFILLILFAAPIKYAVEVIFYFSIPLIFFILTQIQIDLPANKFQNYFILGDPVYSLNMWLVAFLIGAFLSLRPAHIKLFILFVLSGTVIMAVKNIWTLYSSNELQFVFAFRWVNSFINLSIATLLIQRIGLLQQRNATIDALTGILNRHALYPILNQELDRSERYSRPFSVILLDIDEFKVINDTFGHLEGDKVLKELSKLVSGLLRKTDYAGRWGGEEFLLILPETFTTDAQVLAERIREKIEETHFVDKYYLTASFSVSAYHTGQNPETLLECADKALYQAKNNGRNQVVVFQEKQVQEEL